jgi:hypothetical protein
MNDLIKTDLDRLVAQTILILCRRLEEGSKKFIGHKYSFSEMQAGADECMEQARAETKALIAKLDRETLEEYLLNETFVSASKELVDNLMMAACLGKHREFLQHTMAKCLAALEGSTGEQTTTE